MADLNPIAGAATGAFGGIMSYFMAGARNRQLYSAQTQVARAAGIAIDQTQEAAQIDRRRRANQAAQVLGRIRVAAASSGAGVGGSYAALSRAAAYEGSLNDYIIQKNAYNQMVRLSSEAQSQILNLNAQRTSRGVSLLTSGLTGLSIGTSVAGAGLFGRDTESLPTPESSPTGPIDTAAGSPAYDTGLYITRGYQETVNA